MLTSNTAGHNDCARESAELHSPSRIHLLVSKMSKVTFRPKTTKLRFKCGTPLLSVLLFCSAICRRCLYLTVLFQAIGDVAFYSAHIVLLVNDVVVRHLEYFQFKYRCVGPREMREHEL